MKQSLRKSQPKNREKIVFSSIDVVILAGGLGTRLQSVIFDRPKVLADIGGRPFLDILIGDLSSMGFKRVILSVGHLKNQIKNRYAAKKILFAEEENPLGTGGGVKNAESFVKSPDFLVMNGDSWITGGVDLGALYDFHRKKNALVTVALTRPRKEKDYGAVFFSKDGKIVKFNEKSAGEGAHFLNAGIYFMKKTVFARMPRNSFSLETDFFPSLIGDAFYGFVLDGEAIDIGTPERYSLAQKLF